MRKRNSVSMNVKLPILPRILWIWSGIISVTPDWAALRVLPDSRQVARSEWEYVGILLIL